MEWKDDPLIDAVELRLRIFRALKIKDAESLVKVPPKVTSELEQAQIAAFQAQIEQMNRDNERKDIELALKIEEAQPKRMQMIADAVNKLAQAEETENAPEAMKLKAQLDAMTNLNKKMEPYTNGNQPRGAGPMAAAPDNAESPQVPA
jgi:hypothetical protein